MRENEDTVCIAGRVAVFEDGRFGGRRRSAAAFACGDGAPNRGAAAALSRKPGVANCIAELEHTAGTSDALPGDCRSGHV